MCQECSTILAQSMKTSKDLNDMKRSGRLRATTENVDEQISKLADSDHICCNRRYTKCFEAAKHQN